MHFYRLMPAIVALYLILCCVIEANSWPSVILCNILFERFVISCTYNSKKTRYIKRKMPLERIYVIDVRRLGHHTAGELASVSLLVDVLRVGSRCS